MKGLLTLIYLILPIVVMAQIKVDVPFKMIPETECIEEDKKNSNEVVLIFRDKITGDTLTNYQFGVSYFECDLHYAFEHSGFGIISTDSFLLKRNKVAGYNKNKDRLYGYFSMPNYIGYGHRFLIPRNCKKIIVWVCSRDVLYRKQNQ